MRKIFNLFVFLLFSLCASTSWGQTAPVPPPPPGLCQLDRTALIDLYNSTGGDNWTNIPAANKWKQGGVFPATMNNWYGVQINAAGCVTGIDLDGVVDFGVIGGNPDSFASIGGGNNLGGTASNAITKLSTLSELRFLSLCKNPFTTSTIPTSLSSLIRLQHLQLTDCKLTGQIPTFIGTSLLQLVSLSFENNDLRKNTNPAIPSIPTNFSNLTQLRYLYINTNPNLGIGTGPNDELPLNLSNTLRVLSLAGSNLYGTIPPNWNFPNMTELWLRDNKLFGGLGVFDILPARFPKLNWLILQNNNFGDNFTKTIPANLGNLPLTALGLGNNKLIGSIPPNIGTLSNLQYFGVPDNELTGSVPSFQSRGYASFEIQNNKFIFGGMEGKNFITNAGPKKKYEPQAKIPIHNSGNTLYVKVGGTRSKEVFKWYKSGTALPVYTIRGDSIYTPTSCGTYYCEITHDDITRPTPPSDLVTNLILISDNAITTAPAATASSGTPTCVDGSINLFSSGGTSYSWAGPAGFTSNLQNPIRIGGVNTIMSGVYTVTVRNGLGCTATATTSVTVNPKPVIAVRPVAICRGQTATLTASASVIGSSIQWLNCTTGAILANGGNFTTPVLTATTTYCLVATSPQNCNSDRTQVVVTVNALPTATATSNSPVCAGASLNLSSSGGVSYAWAGPNTFTSALQNPVRANATTAMGGVYTVTVKNATGCTAIATTSVVVNAKPTLFAATPRPICRGTSTTLTATSSAGSTIQWLNCTTGAVLATGGSFTTPALAVSTNYCVVATSPQGCKSDKVEVAVTVKECCADVKYDVKCGAKLGTYDVYFSFTNLSGQIIDRVRPVISTPGVTANVPFINMNPLVQAGATSATYSFTISGATAGQKLCMSLVLQKECDFKCQTPEFCVELPKCIDTPVSCNLKYGIDCQDPTGLRIKWYAVNADGSMNTNVASISFNFNQANFLNSPALNTFTGYSGDACIILDPAVKLPSKLCGVISMFDAKGNLLCKQEYCFELPYCKICQFEAGIEGVTSPREDVKWEVTNAPERTNLSVYACTLKEFTMFVYGSYSDIVPVLPLPDAILYVTPNLSSQSVSVGVNYTLITAPTVFKLLLISKDSKCCAKVLTVTVLPCPRGGRVGLNEPITPEDANSYITVFPNPVQDEEITVELKDSDWTKAQLVDSNGIKLSSVQRNGESNQFKMKIPFITGTYFIRVESSNGIFTKTVVR